MHYFCRQSIGNVLYLLNLCVKLPLGLIGCISSSPWESCIVQACTSTASISYSVSPLSCPVLTLGPCVFIPLGSKGRYLCYTFMRTGEMVGDIGRSGLFHRFVAC